MVLSPYDGAEPKSYRKHYVPLESNPEVFNRLIQKLGVSCGSKARPGLEFFDVLSLDQSELLAMIPRPVLALILIFPTTKVYEQEIAELEHSRPEYTGSGEDEEVIWFQQTIHNACGLYGILHAVSNGKARDFIGQYAELVLPVTDFVTFKVRLTPNCSNRFRISTGQTLGHMRPVGPL